MTGGRSGTLVTNLKDWLVPVCCDIGHVEGATLRPWFFRQGERILFINESSVATSSNGSSMKATLSQMDL